MRVVRHPLILVVTALLSNVGRADVWNCRNDIEVQCTRASCGAESEEGGFTPMSLAFSSTGSFSLCAYSGCWEADGAVVSTAPFLIITQEKAEWSDPSSNGERDADVMIALDLQDQTAIIKAAGFVTPFHCQRKGGEGHRAEEFANLLAWGNRSLGYSLTVSSMFDR
jgi:hypothetical protein